MPYFHVVYTLPAPITDLAYTNKAVIYDILFKASAEATLTIAADRKRLGAKVGITSVLHTWGSASCRRRASGTMTHHPHVHLIVRPCGAWLRHDAAGCRRTDRSGSPADRSSSCPCVCCRACSGVS